MPAPGNEWEFLQSVLMRLYNRVVRDDFRDGIPDDTISTPESALRYACLIKDNDTAPMALCRMFLYFLVRGRGLEEPSIPMIWELKKGTYKLRDQSQLLVQWGPVSGTKRYSRWKMYIPHPKDGIRDNYNFRFPQFTKGNVTCTLTLRDGSSVVLNANSKAEGRKVLNYCETLISWFAQNREELKSYPVSAR